MSNRSVAVVGAGWAGLSAAIAAVLAGARVTVFEASRSLGGRARRVSAPGKSAGTNPLDNGQHILIGAYQETLGLLKLLGLDEHDVLLRQPLSLRSCDGFRLDLPDLAAPWDVGVGIARAQGWTLKDKLALLQRALHWRSSGFNCRSDVTVADLASGLPAAVQSRFVDPICVSALNTPAQQASGQVFLRVLGDAVFGPRGSSNLLLPRVDLSGVLPDPAVAWLRQRGANVRVASRVNQLGLAHPDHVRIGDEVFDHAVLAVAPGHAAALMRASITSAPEPVQTTAIPWIARAEAIRFNAIATCYAQFVAPARPDAIWPLPGPMTALLPRIEYPAQFVFDRSRLGADAGSLAFVISASSEHVASVQAAVVNQARHQLGIIIEPTVTIIEKQATFACTPGLARPGSGLLPTLSAAGDYCEGPYPATLEGAVRSGLAAGVRAATGLPARQHMIDQVNKP